MLRFTLATFGLGWAFIIAVAVGLIAQDSRLGFGPLALLGASTLAGLMGGLEDPEKRAPYFLLAAAAFASGMLYVVLRYFMLLAWAGH